MLVLTRKIGETIQIGDNVVIQILSMHKGNARVGVTAPLDIVVDRGEVAERKKAEQHQHRLELPR